jgi:hypothetical protein
MGMGRSDILTEELKKVLLDIEYWLKDMYLEGIKVNKSALSGATLEMHNEWITGINESLVLISSVLHKGYYTSEEKEVLNLLRKSWIEEKKASYKV